MRHELARRAVLAIAALSVVITGVVIAPAPQAEAADISSWDAGYIISDELFYDGNAMAEADVAWFLRNANPAPCSAGYTCLKDYTAPTWTRPADPMCGQYSGGGIETAAAIITKVGKACGISQKVLLVLLQKEQSLVTHTSPTPGRYGAAMGFACPDTAPCDAEYFGFYNQVYKAAWQFKRYGNPPGSSNYFTWIPVGKVSQIYYHPNVYCFSSPVLIKNKATAALYYYTPYQPNASALANLYSTGDECGSYGNRNFWRLYSDWFGSPNGSDSSFVRAVYEDLLGRAPDAGGLSYWTARLRAGESRLSVSEALTSSREYRIGRITATYQEYLGRAPEPAGLDFWLVSLDQGFVRTDQLGFSFLGAPEYFANLGNSEAAFDEAIFQKILGRSPSAGELVYYSGRTTDALRSGTIDAIYRSPESVGIRVRGMYQFYLGRAAADGEVAYWLSHVQQGGDPAMIRAILISQEYDQRAKARFPG